MNMMILTTSFRSGSVSSDDISDGLTANGTISSLRPLMNSALEAQAHVTTGVDDTVHLTLIADHALGGGQAAAVVWGARLGPRH